jgi:hypothetical protein
MQAGRGSGERGTSSWRGNDDDAAEAPVIGFRLNQNVDPAAA